jgi:hypothetical protein
MKEITAGKEAPVLTTKVPADIETGCPPKNNL